MPTNDALKDTLDHFREREQRLVAELQSVRLTIRNLERELGIESAEEQAGETPALPPAPQLSPFVSAPGKKTDIRPDEFFGKTFADASRDYLKRVGHAVSLEELLDALIKGGCKVGGVDPKRTLYISLIRNTRDFVPPQKGYIGLREFYPAGARVKETREKPQKRKASKGVRKGRGTAAKNEAPPSKLAATVREVMSDKQPRSPEQIIQAVGAKLGEPVKKIGVFGVLRNKGIFEKVDGQYRLR